MKTSRGFFYCIQFSPYLSLSTDRDRTIIIIPVSYIFISSIYYVSNCIIYIYIYIVLMLCHSTTVCMLLYNNTDN